MIHPSYSELIEAINTNNEDDDEALVLNSRYSLFHKITHKRSLQIIQILPLDPINDAQKDSQYEKHTPCCSRQFLHIK